MAEKDAQLQRRHKKGFRQKTQSYRKSDVSLGSNVWINDKHLEGTVIDEAAPRSFEVETSDGV